MTVATPTADQVAERVAHAIEHGACPRCTTYGAQHFHLGGRCPEEVVAVHACRTCGVPLERTGKRGRPRVYCPPCRTAPKPTTPRFDAERADRMVAAYVHDDLTYEQIGQRHGITRERVRQIIKRHDPTLLALAKRRRAARTRLRRFVAEGRSYGMRDCALCGESFTAQTMRQRYCSPVHQKVRVILRFQVDDEARAKHMVVAAKWVLANPEHPAAQSRANYTDRLLNGLVGTEGTMGGAGQRWLVPGSLPFHWALRAYVLDWPIFEQFHPDVQDQIRAHLAGDAA